MKTLPEIRQQLKHHQKHLQTHCPFTQLYIFGSYARGTPTPTSDRDILIDYDRPPTLLHLITLKQTLETLLDLPVDIVTRNGLKPRLRQTIESELIPID